MPIKMKNCHAEGNRGAGFLFDGNFDAEIEECTAKNNEGGGFVWLDKHENDSLDRALDKLALAIKNSAINSVKKDIAINMIRETSKSQSKKDASLSFGRFLELGADVVTVSTPFIGAITSLIS